MLYFDRMGVICLLLNELLKSKRKEAGLSQSEFADRVGVSKATASRWESGVITGVRVDKVLTLCELLNVTPEEIMEAQAESKAAAGETVSAPVTPKPSGGSPTDEDIKAALWGGDKDLSPADVDALWDDAVSYIRFRTEQKKKKKG